MEWLKLAEGGPLVLAIGGLVVVALAMAKVVASNTEALAGLKASLDTKGILDRQMHENQGKQLDRIEDRLSGVHEGVLSLKGGK